MQNVIVRPKTPSIDINGVAKKLKDRTINSAVNIIDALPKPRYEAKPYVSWSIFWRYSLYALGFLTWFISSYFQ